MKLDEILASWENRPEAFTGQKVDEATFIGPNSQAWQSGAYQEALKLEKQGVSPEDIWARTGTGRSIDGKWRQEISDNESYMRNIGKDTKINFSKLNDAKTQYDGPRFSHSVTDTRGRPTKDFINDLVNDISVAHNAPEMNIGGGSLMDVLEHQKLNEAYPGIQTSRIDFLPSKYPNGEVRAHGLQGQHLPTIEGELDNRAYTSDGMSIIDMMNGDKQFNGQFPRTGKVYDHKKVEQGFGPAKNELEQRVRQNMSVPNISIVAPSDKEKKWRSGGRSYNTIFDTLLHENQHSIQSLEGFGMGDSSVIDKLMSGAIGDKNIALADMDNADKEKQRTALYKLQPGEAEARLTSRRRMLDDQGRRQNFPFKQTQELNKPNGTYGFDIDPVKAGRLWASHSPVDRPVIDPPTVLPGAKAGTPVNRPPETSVEPEYSTTTLGLPVNPNDPKNTGGYSPEEPRVEVAPPEQEPFMPTEPDFTKRPGYIEPETIIDLPTQTPSAPEPEQMPIDTHGHGHEEDHGEQIPLPPNEGFPWGKLFGGDLSIEETWDAIPGTDIEDWKKKMPPVGNGVGGFMKEELTQDQIDKLLQEMLRNGKIRSNR